MATVEDVARSALAALSTDAGLLRTATWASERYRELTSQARFKHLRQVGELTIAAPITSGTATVASLSNVVVGDATSSPLWTSDLVGRHFRVTRNWYQIVDVITSATAAQLILASPYIETTTGATAYRVNQRYVRLPKGLRILGEVVFMRLFRRLVPKSLLEANMNWPARNVTAGGPTTFVDLGVDPETRQRLIEPYPYSATAEQLVFSYYPTAPELRLPDDLPAEVDVALLKAGVLIDCYRYEMAKAQRAGDPSGAALWRNELRAQETTWDRKIQDMIRNDRAGDDVAFLLQLGRSRGDGNSMLIAPGGRDQSGVPVGWPW